MHTIFLDKKKRNAFRNELENINPGNKCTNRAIFAPFCCLKDFCTLIKLVYSAILIKKTHKTKLDSLHISRKTTLIPICHTSLHCLLFVHWFSQFFIRNARWFLYWANENENFDYELATCEVTFEVYTLLGFCVVADLNGKRLLIILISLTAGDFSKLSSTILYDAMAVHISHSSINKLSLLSPEETKQGDVHFAFWLVSIQARTDTKLSLGYGYLLHRKVWSGEVHFILISRELF